jgi:hypothetical protein
MIEGRRSSFFYLLFTSLKIFHAVSPINGREGKNYSRGLYVCDLIHWTFIFLKPEGPFDIPHNIRVKSLPEPSASSFSQLLSILYTMLYFCRRSYILITTSFRPPYQGTPLTTVGSTYHKGRICPTHFMHQKVGDVRSSVIAEIMRREE